MRGFVKQRSEGATFTAYWESKDRATGKRRQHSKGGFRTKGAAQRFLSSQVAAVVENRFTPEQHVTVQALFDSHWLPAQRSRGLRPATLDMYERAVKTRIVPTLGATRVSALTPADVDRLVSTMGKLSPRSRQIVVATLKAATKWAFEVGLVARDPLAGVKRPAARAPEMHVWSRDDAAAFLRSVADDRNYWAWLLLLSRGLRRGEVCGLTWEAIDFDAKLLHVRRTRIVVDGKALDSEPKTSAGRRAIPLDDTLAAVLRSHKARLAGERLAAGPAYVDGGWLFCDELGHPCYPDSLSTWWDRRVATAGVPRIRLHDARHTAATHLLAAGTPVTTVARLLGHSSPVVTLQTYSHLLPGQVEEAGAALTAALLG